MISMRAFGSARRRLAPQIQQMLWKLYHTLDWAASNNLLETPR